MNILIVGNGFDLAHGLPTQYKDFLKFVNLANAILDDDLDTIKNIENSDGNDDKEIKKTKDFKEFINSLRDKENFKYIEELHKLSIDNLWFDYFNLRLKENLLFLKENWIDFECEISKIIIFLDKLNKKKNSFLLENNDQFLFDEPFFEINENEMAILIKPFVRFFNKNEYYPRTIIKNGYKFFVKTFELFKNTLINDLNQLIRCLEIYLSLYINNLDKGLVIPEILNLKDKIDHVLSFNYTNTFERFYGRPNVEYDYIHGKASLDNTFETCQLVLGIDEYLDKEERNENIEFIQYKKYFQRIYKRTGRKYKDWLKQIEKDNLTNRMFFGSKELNIYILGHSLDITDKDILKDLITFYKEENSNGVILPVKIIIYNHNQRATASHIANLVRVITQGGLIDNVYGKDKEDPRIVFKHQNESIALYPHITQAAHNDYLDEPGEKENIQSDLDEMDSWDNEE